MKLLLMERGLWGFTQQGQETQPDENAAATVRNAFRLRSDKAYSLIALNVEKDIQVHISSVTDPLVAWERLQQQFEFVSITQIVRLSRKFYAASMEENGDLVKHITYMTSLAEQLRELNEEISSKKFATVVLGSLPESYDNFLTSLNARKSDELDWEHVKGLLVEEHMKRTDKVEKRESDSALFARKDRGNFNKQRGGSGRHGSGKVFANGQGNRNGFSRSHYVESNSSTKHKGMRCFKCNGIGHVMRNCTYRKPNDSANILDLSHTECGGIALISSTMKKPGKWFIDSAATKHMTYDRQGIENYVEYKEPTKIYLGNDTVILAHGEGNVHLTTCNPPNVSLDLHKVLYVPNLTKNLLSVPAMALMGAEVKFDSGSCIIAKDGKEFIIGSLLDKKLYEVNIAEHANVAHNNKSCRMWHCRLGHLNYDYINELVKKEMVKGMDCDSNNQRDRGCEACILGKMKKKPFPTQKEQERRANKPFEIVHSDVCGPMQVNSKGGSRYMLTFIDDYSRYTIVYFIQSKCEVLSKFKEYVSYVKKQFGHEIMTLSCEESFGYEVQTIRSDNGGEYTSNDFKFFCSERGIGHEYTTPYSPEQNGVAERLNRTIIESARAMLNHAKLPLDFWAEACSTAVYLHNRSPTTALKGVTPFEHLFGRKPNISHLRVFGCVSYMHIPSDQRKKLDPKARKTIFVGYPPGVKGYKLYDTEKRSFRISRNVLFLEDKFDHFGKKPESSVKPDLNGVSQIDVENDFVPELTEEKIPVERENVQPVGATISTNERERTYEDKFMTEVRNLGPVRERKAPLRFQDEICNMVFPLTSEVDEPKTVDEALNGEQSRSWQEAMRSEFKSLLENDTWELVPAPKDKNIVGSKWVFKVKRNQDGSVDRYKARLVAKGFSQMKGIDYNEVFSPVTHNASLRSLLAIANAHDYEIHQMDVKTAFLNGTLDCDIYMEQPEGFVDKDRPNHVCKLMKSIYGLKQSARCWNTTINEYLQEADYHKSEADGCIYVKSLKESDGSVSFVILSIYVDDIVAVSNNPSMLKAEKAALCSRFKMVDQGEIHYLLGMSIKRDRVSRTLTIDQQSYLESLLKRFEMENSKPVSTPIEAGKKFQQFSEGQEPFDVNIYQQAIGCLTYASTATRPDIAAAVGMLSQYSSRPSKDHWIGIKRILRYIRGTIHYGLKFSGLEANTTLIGFSDADWAGDLDTRKSTSGYVFQIGGATVSWCSRKQSTVAKSSTEAEYVALSSATQEAIWLRRLMKDLGSITDKPTTIFQDNQGAIELAKNDKYHTRTKHIDICHHFVRERVFSEEIKVIYCPSDSMVADIMTKGLPKSSFEKLRQEIGIQNID